MRTANGTLSDLTLALNEAITELDAPITPADGTLASATTQLNALLVWSHSVQPPADGTLAGDTSTYNAFVAEATADLIDRISGECNDLILPRPKINLHRFMGVERLYAFGEWTRLQIAAEFDLEGAEATQAGQIADKIDAQSNATNKIIYIARVESVLMCTEDQEDTFYHSAGVVNKPKVYEDLQITG